VSDGSRETIQRADASARRAAQTQFGAPLLVEAGAGTGKTAVLVARIVAWCLGPGWERARARAPGAPDAERERIAADVLSRVAAITFTEAAAAEMAERVDAALAGIAGDELPLGVLADALPPASPERRARARALCDASDHLVVVTIHAWCRRLLARRPLAAGLHPAFGVDADESQQAEVARQVVEETLHRAYGSPERADLLDLAVDGFGPERVEEALGTLLREGVTDAAFARDPLAPARAGASFGRLRAALEALRDAGVQRLGGVRSRRSQAARAAVLDTISLLSELGAAPGREALCDGARRLRALWSRPALERLAEWARARFDAGETGALGAGRDAVASAAQRVQPWIKALADFDPERLERARRALAPLLADARRALRRRGVLAFADLLREARDLLQGDPEVCAQVRRELDLLLVDEFQDTDPLQCEIVARLALAEGAAPSLFVVGDPKQSIYGWRRADLAAYDAFGASLRAAGGEVHRLAVNHRSAPAILEEVERAIAPVMARELGVQPAFQRLLPSEENAGVAGFAAGAAAPVEHWVSWDWDGVSGAPDPGVRNARAAALEAAALARDLRTLHEAHGVAWREVGILLRTTGDLDRILEALRRAGVPYEVERDRSYYRRREVIEAAATVRCVLDPNDHLALLTFLRSAAVGVPDAALVPLWCRDFPQRASALGGADASSLRALEAAVREVAADLPAGVPGLERIAGWEANLMAALESLGTLRASFARDPVDVFVEKLRQLLLLEVSEASRFLGAYRAANLERFFAELSRELAGGGDPELVLRRLRTSVQESRETDDARPRDAVRDAVRVMTIHKAKGLDFDHVYVLQLHKASARPSGPAPALEVEEGEDGVELRLFGAATPGFAERAARREARAGAERVRELYVAMTRARVRLVLGGKWPGAAEAKPVARAASLVDLLGGRRADPETLTCWMRELAEAGDEWRDAAEARFRFLALAPQETAAGPPVSAGAELPAAPVLRAAAVQLARHREDAQRRMARPLSRAASSRGGGEEPDPEAQEERAERRFGARLADPEARAGAPASRSAAQLAGSAVHALLEAFDLGSGDAAAELARGRRRLRERLAGEGGLAEAARVRAEQVLDAFARGPLLPRFAGLAGRVVARELALLCRPLEEARAPVGCETGVVDLVYRDEAGRLVVADYKTDRAGEAELPERRARYQAQARFYAEALRRALALDYLPRAELWFLEPGRIERIDA
jgi:ATP-dependent helicase/nuclease subunit A